MTSGRSLNTAYEPLLGTVVEVRVEGEPSRLRDADRAVIREIRRLERILSVFDPSSELSRWRDDEGSSISPDLVEVLRLSRHWQRFSGGAFNPRVGILDELWRRGETAGSRPESKALAATAASIREPCYEFTDGIVRSVADCSAINVNALAKGYIVDRAVAAGFGVGGIDRVVVNAGGDLRHHGSGVLRVGIENPATPFDNVRPLLTVTISNCAVATSGSARRGFRIGSDWYSHVLDPRTGEPVSHTRSATVIAEDAATADVLATVAGVLQPTEACDLVDSLPGASCCVVDQSNRIWLSRHWPTVTSSQ